MPYDPIRPSMPPHMVDHQWDPMLGAWVPRFAWGSAPDVVLVDPDEEAQTGMSEESKAEKEGRELGEALSALFGIGDRIDIRAATNVGKWFARAGGYNAMEPGFQFVGAFIVGLQDGARSAAPREVAGPTEPDAR